VVDNVSLLGGDFGNVLNSPTPAWVGTGQGLAVKFVNSSNQELRFGTPPASFLNLPFWSFHALMQNQRIGPSVGVFYVVQSTATPTGTKLAQIQIDGGISITQATSGTAIDVRCDTPLNLNQWYSVTGTISRTLVPQGSIYINGIDATTTRTTGTGTISAEQTSILRIAGNASGGNFTGYLAMFAMWDRMLAPWEAASLSENPWQLWVPPNYFYNSLPIPTFIPPTILQPSYVIELPDVNRLRRKRR
jgi:hypothetical protein